MNSSSSKLEMENPLPLDATIISGTQSLGIWLQEDESLHSEACGVMDVLLGLIKEGPAFKIDYGAWLTPAVLALISTEKGREEFIRHDGYSVIKERLEKLRPSAPVAELENANHDLEILRSIAPSQTERWEHTHAVLVDKILTSN